VVLTHANYLWGAGQMCLHQRLAADDVYLVQMPLFHVNAQIYSVLASWAAGAAVVLVPGFSRSGFWRAAAHHGATASSMIPFFVMALLRHPDGTRIPRDVLPEHAFRLWGYGITSGKVDQRFRLKTLGWYGMTETVSAAVIGPWDATAPEGAIGRPAPGYQVRLLDDEGIPVPPTVPGAVYVRGERGVTLALEYHNRPRATAAAFSRDGWFATGDRMRYDEDGWLYFVDREKDMLKVGGENVASSEIERVIQEVPGVLEVAVIGLADALLDEVPAACVIATPGAEPDELRERILAHARGKLADFKVPRRIELVDSLPRATLEKVNKAALRAALSERIDT
jgi:crotonobetaine/carnitine-CoA ligase